MKIKRIPTPNRDDWEIPVEYLVLHYTAVDLQDTLAIFTRPGGVVSAHIVIDTDGSVYELVDCFNGKALRSRHAGPSRWNAKEGLKEQFNDFSIGIELVNYNGNIFSYSEEQYSALVAVIKRLQEHYPSLKNPERILGHEHIAGFRGKADPGLCFDWHRIFQSCFTTKDLPLRNAVCPDELQASLIRFKGQEPEDRENRSLYWQSVSHITETAIKLIHDAENDSLQNLNE